MKTKAFLVGALLLCSATASQAEIIDTGTPLNPFGLELRLGINESEISNNLMDAAPHCVINNSWGSGFSVGAVVDLKLKNYISIQPGIFYQSRNMSYKDMFDTAYPGIIEHTSSYISGKVRSYDITIPVLASVKLNFTPIFTIRVEAGPYFQFGTGGNNKYDFTTAADVAAGIDEHSYTYKTDVYGDDGGLRTFDWGLKFGVGCVFAHKFSLNIHYLSGFKNAYKAELSDNLKRDLKGHHKAWEITLGYTIF